MDGPTLGFELGEELRIAQAMMWRRSATPQDKMSSQNKNRAKRARRVIRSLFVCVDGSSFVPQRPRCAKCMQGEKGVSNENVQIQGVAARMGYAGKPKINVKIDVSHYDH
jgi:hypothetical protein